MVVEVNNVSIGVEWCDQQTNQSVANDTVLDETLLIREGSWVRPFLLPLWQQLLWTVVFCAMVTVATLGNLLVIWVVLAHRRMRTVTNYFLLNLALADLMIATLNVIFNFVYMLQSHWPFGRAYCTLINFMANLTVAASVFTIAAMSVDRYVAVVHPLTRRMPRKMALVVIGLIWLCGTLLALPNLLYSVNITFRYPDNNLRTLCFLVWPDGPAGTSQLDYIYNILFLMLTYLLPVVAMALTYSRMGRVLWGNKGIGEGPQEQAIRAKRKVAKMLFTMMFLFTIFWLPYHLYFLYAYHNPEFIYTDYVQHLYLAIYLLSMSHSMLNPIVYYRMNGRFRGYFRLVLCYWRVNGGSSRHSSRPAKQVMNIEQPQQQQAGWRRQTTSWRSTVVSSLVRTISRQKSVNTNV